MKRSTVIVIGICLSALFVCSAAAEDACFAQVRSELSGIEAQIPAVKKGDGKTANQLINVINATIAKLNQCDKQNPAFAELGKHAKDLDGWTRAQALGQPKPEFGKPDEWLQKALAEIQAVETDLSSLKPGDTAMANSLVTRLNGSRDLLSKSLSRSLPAWKDAAAKADALDKQVRNRVAEAPAGGPAVGGQTTAPKSAAPGLKMLPEDIAKGMEMNDKYAFTSELEPAYKDCANMINNSDPRAWADEWNVGKVQSCRERMDKALLKIKSHSHPAVQQAKAMIAEMDSVFATKQAEGKRMVAEDKAKAQATAGEIDTRLSEIEAFFDPKTFTIKLEPPFTPERVHEWVARLKEYQALQKKGIALLDAVVKDHPEQAGSQRVKNLRYWFNTAMPKALTRDVGLTTEWYKDGPTSTQGTMLFHLDRVKNLLKPGTITEDLLQRDDWVEQNIVKVEQAVQGADALVQFYKEYHNQDDEVYIKASLEVHALLDRLQTGAAKAAKNVRMPPAKSMDAKHTAVAKGKVEDCGAGAYERMVINYGPAHKSEQKTEARVDGDYLRIWKWTEEWDEFQVTLAEKFDTNPFGAMKMAGGDKQMKERKQPGPGGDYRLVSYLFKNYTKGPSWKTLHTWLCAERIVGKKILKENIKK